jgi:peroxiredoxin Q/BCP
MPRLEPGDKAPAFSLKDQDGKTVRLSQFKGSMVLLYFYPKADTPGCTKQSCAVRDAKKSLAKDGVTVLGISPDAPDAQKKFDAKFRLGFPLLADTEHAVAEAYGVWGEKSLYGRKFLGITRSAFVIDEKGKIARAKYGVKPDRTVEEALAALEG